MSIGELGCPNLEYVYEMTWAEFRIRLYAYNRVEKREWYKVREMAWASLIGKHINPKELPKTKEAFMPLDSENKTDISEAVIERIKAAQNQYLKDKQ